MSRGKRKQKTQSFAPGEQLTDEQVLEVADAIAGLPLEALPVTCPFPGAPDMGDKDPEVMAWYRDNAHEEFARRYANRTIPTNLPEPKIETGPPTDFEDEEEPMKKPHVIMQ